ncbi:hypothetical protein [Pantoea sp. C2G6]|uniref:HofO family protein n=1 Tax=Pantoea sp. C2G6 TaxID=3243084 RepID=UPI003EDA1F9E
MNEWWDRWWQMAAIPRYSLLVPGLSGLWLLLWALWLRPQQQRLDTEQQALIQLTRTLQQHQQRWQQHPDNAALQSQLLSLQARVQRPGESVRAVETILAARRDQLEEWQPGADLPMLTLHLPWQAFQPLFGELAQVAAPLPRHFQLLAQPQHLVAQLWLEPDDAP